MDVLTAIHGRRSIRKYLSDPVARDAIGRSSVGGGAGTDAAGERRDALVAPRHRRRGSAWKPMASARQSSRASTPMPNGRTSRGFKVFWGAPVLILISARRDNAEALFDCCRAGQNLLLAAHARGLGTCWLGAPIPWPASAEVRRRSDGRRLRSRRCHCPRLSRRDALGPAEAQALHPLVRRPGREVISAQPWWMMRA